MKKNNKGFTLVELIVVLVILAILAAILVPALLGYIDKARSSQYLEEAHSILTAAQAWETEQYAKGATTPTTEFKTGDDSLTYVNGIVSPTNVSTLKVSSSTAGDGTTVGSNHAKFTIGAIDELTFKSQNGKTVSITMNAENKHRRLETDLFPETRSPETIFRKAVQSDGKVTF